MMVGVIWITFSDPPLRWASNKNKPCSLRSQLSEKKRNTVQAPVFFLFRPTAAIAAGFYFCLVGVIWITFSDPPLRWASNKNKPCSLRSQLSEKKRKPRVNPCFLFYFVHRLLLQPGFIFVWSG